MVTYLVKSPRHLVQLLGCNVIRWGYRFYSTGWIPEEKDPLLVDAKLLLTYACYLPKHTVSRRRKAGIASVKYFRCGQLFVLIATEGRSPFFQREAFKDLKSSRLHIAGYALGMTQDGNVYVRLHKEAKRRLKKQFLERASWSIDFWRRTLRNFPFSGWRGVHDDLFQLFKELNYARKLLRLQPLIWNDCIRKKVPREPVYLETPKEVADLIKLETTGRKAPFIV